MNKTKRLNLFFNFLVFIFLFLIPINVFAGSAGTSFSGPSSVYIGKNLEVTLVVNSVEGTNGGLAAFGGNITYNTNLLELVKTTSLAPFNVELVGSKLGGFGQNTINGRANIMRFTFKTKGLGSATIKYSGSSQPDAIAQPVVISGSSKTINITEPPSTNNKLASLSVSNGSINFNKDTTNYKVNVESDVTSINISATAEDKGATISGLGTKNLNFGDNTFNIVVTAPSGDKLTYKVIVNRKDNRSSNNNLKSLSINGFSLNPTFNKNTTTYNIDVPFSVTSINVSATPEDSKSKVNISGTSSLKPEEVNKVLVKVTAENGKVKTYTINVKRGKDPNKVLSNNNYLEIITSSVGELNPGFNKDILNYEISVPFSVRELDFITEVEDKKYATIKKEGPNTLSVGKNKFKFIVTAEDNSTRTYVILVNREKDPNAPASTNTYLKNIIVKNGELLDDFQKDNYVYFYKKDNNFKIDAVPEDKDSRVTILENENVYTIVVEAPSGDISSYTLVLKEKNYLWMVISGVLLVVGTGIGYYCGKNKAKRKTKKVKEK